MYIPRNGQWVTFLNRIDGAHTAEGRTVGIFKIVTIELPIPHQMYLVYPCNELGENIVSDPGDPKKGVPPKNLSLSLYDCMDIKPLVSLDHIPEQRRAKLMKGWTPKP
jgi:hypothetical protein